ncbi:TPA: tail fiber assembly protein [Citrobacter freundii]|nr:tail fiber assembly protein [Citrobacter freundii]HCA0667808.1 tail fiber assembly protein [Citrobacter freundii]HCA1830425.1 tail fiber assembly protein [Citrobacter freundii]HCA1944189.1 tail fiber assembly protein [Citrobacter freundii]HCA2697002.1 tail fiber assembly protein [Citrobacter freundii]
MPQSEDGKRAYPMSYTHCTYCGSRLQDAVDLDIATEAEAALLLAWKKYRVLLNRINPNDTPDINWPEQPAERSISG